MNDQYYGGDYGGEYGYIPPNTPISKNRSYGDQIDFIKELLNKDELKEKISQDLQLYFSTFTKNLAIGNFTETEIRMMMLRFDDMKTAYLMRLPPGAYSWQIEYEFTALRNVLCAELTRGREGFERKLMATSINQTYMQSDFRNNMAMGNNNGGILNRFRRFFSR